MKDFLRDKVTMYRLVIYLLIAFVVEAFLLSAFDILSFTFVQLLVSLGIICFVALITHAVCQYIYKAPSHSESTYISALILFLIIAPPSSVQEVVWTVLASCMMIGSKYIIAHKHRHIFNPVAVALVIVGLLGSFSSIWWVGSIYFAPLSIISFVAIIYKLRRYSLALSYCAATVVTMCFIVFFQGSNAGDAVIAGIISSQFLFLGAFMVTEPFTTPPTKKKQGVYGALIGAFSFVPFSTPLISMTPELALLIGNCFGYFFGTKSRGVLSFVSKKEIARDVYEFTFVPKEKMTYQSGQYTEWTLPHDASDTRGIRRYFTIASSPDESVIRLGVKCVEKGSTFKEALAHLSAGDKVTTGIVMGDFLLPADTTKKILFIAGGIGITPFVSMIRTCLLRHEKRNIILLYANKTKEDIAYMDIIAQAERECDMRTVHVLSEEKEFFKDEQHIIGGFITEEMIQKYVPDIVERDVYISGPPQMVARYEDVVKKMGVSREAVVTDFFPGFA